MGEILQIPQGFARGAWSEGGAGFAELRLGLIWWWFPLAAKR